MAEEPDSLVPRNLRRFDEKIDRLSEGVRAVNQWLGAPGTGQALLAHAVASISRRIDRRDERVERIERRRDLVAV